MGQLLAITRAVSPAIARCELTHLSRVPIDPDKAAAQHADYERALERMGCAVRRIAAGQDLPDSVFIEDAAVVLDEVAIVTRPGVDQRQRIFFDQVNVDGTNVERRGYTDSVNSHEDSQ